MIAGHLARCRERIPRPLLRAEGRVTGLRGLVVEGHAPDASAGEVYRIHSPGGASVEAEVVGLRGERALLVPLGDASGVGVGSTLRRAGGGPPAVPVGEGYLGRVIDGAGRPLDGRPAPGPDALRPLRADPLPPLARAPIREPMPIGVRAIDGLATLGCGQRIGLFAGAGVGKSVLAGQIARAARADVIVLALIGERGREVGEFVRGVLGPEGLARAVVVAATSDRPPAERVRGALCASAHAEHFRERGARVLLLMDSLTRLAMAQREIGLAVGEPPATKGYPPSAFALLARVVERMGAAEGGGSATGIYTVLVEGDDLSDPVADAARALLDGHIVLSRARAERGAFPAVDAVASVSRVMPDVVPAEHLRDARALRAMLARLRDAEDLIQAGAYREGADPALDAALARLEAIETFLRQAPDEATELAETRAALRALAGDAGGAR